MSSALLASAVVLVAFLFGVGFGLGLSDLRQMRREAKWRQDRYAIIDGEPVVLCSIRFGHMPDELIS